MFTFFLSIFILIIFVIKVIIFKVIHPSIALFISYNGSQAAPHREVCQLLHLQQLRQQLGHTRCTTGNPA